MKTSLFVLMLMLPTSAWAWCDHCGGDGSCCRCPTGQAQCLYGHSSCEDACGISKGGSSSSSGSGGSVETVIVNELIKGLFNGAQESDAHAAELQRQAEERAAIQKQKDAEQAEIRRQEAEARAAEQERQAEEAKDRLLGNKAGSNPSDLSLMNVEKSSELKLVADEPPQLELSASPSIEKKPSPPKIDLKKRSIAYNKGFETASLCYSQNVGSACMDIAAETGQICIDDYKGGYAAGEKRQQIMLKVAFQAGEDAGKSGALANGATDSRAQGSCRTQWIESYEHGYVKGKHAGK